MRRFKIVYVVYSYMNRRSFIKGSAVMSCVALAGCITDDNNDRIEVPTQRQRDYIRNLENPGESPQLTHTLQRDNGDISAFVPIFRGEGNLNIYHLDANADGDQFYTYTSESSNTVITLAEEDELFHGLLILLMYETNTGEGFYDAHAYNAETDTVINTVLNGNQL